MTKKNIFFVNQPFLKYFAVIMLLISAALLILGFNGADNNFLEDKPESQFSQVEPTVQPLSDFFNNDQVKFEEGEYIIGDGTRISANSPTPVVKKKTNSTNSVTDTDSTCPIDGLEVKEGTAVSGSTCIVNSNQ